MKLRRDRIPQPLLQQLSPMPVDLSAGMWLTGLPLLCLIPCLGTEPEGLATALGMREKLHSALEGERTKTRMPGQQGCVTFLKKKPLQNWLQWGSLLTLKEVVGVVVERSFLLRLALELQERRRNIAEIPWEEVHRHTRPVGGNVCNGR
jgi:hypothetical protein